MTLLSSLGKLFSSLVYERIENERESKDMLSKSIFLNMPKTLVAQIKGNKIDSKNFDIIKSIAK